MSNRYVSTAFWDDEWVQDLDSEGKVLYLYLLTCQSANIAGIYKISVRRMAFDTAVSEERVRELLGQFEEAGKVYRFREYVILKNWLKYQNSRNVRVRTGIERILKDLPSEIFDFCMTNGLLMYDQYMGDTLDSDTKPMGDTSDADNNGIGHEENDEKSISVHKNSDLDFNLDLDLDLDLKNTNTISPELAKDATPASPVVITIPLIDKTEFKVSEKLVDQLREYYPAIDILAEIKKAAGWCVGNPKNRKTRRGVMRFLTSWLARAQDRARPSLSSPPAVDPLVGRDGMPTSEAWKRFAEEAAREDAL